MYLLPQLCDINAHSGLSKASILFCSIQNKSGQTSARIWDFKESSLVRFPPVQKTEKKNVETGEKPENCCFVLEIYSYLHFSFSSHQQPPPRSADAGLVPRMCDPFVECQKTIWNKGLCQLLLKGMKTNLGSWILCCSSHKWIVTWIYLRRCKLEQG